MGIGRSQRATTRLPNEASNRCFGWWMKKMETGGLAYTTHTPGSGSSVRRTGTCKQAEEQVVEVKDTETPEQETTT